MEGAGAAPAGRGGAKAKGGLAEGEKAAKKLAVALFCAIVVSIDNTAGFIPQPPRTRDGGDGDDGEDEEADEMPDFWGVLGAFFDIAAASSSELCKGVVASFRCAPSPPSQPAAAAPPSPSFLLPPPAPSLPPHPCVRARAHPTPTPAPSPAPSPTLPSSRADSGPRIHETAWS